MSILFGEVVSSEPLGAAMRRVVLGGGTLDRFHTTEATDQYINGLFLPADSPLVPPFHLDEARTMAEARPRPRRITVRHWDAVRQQLTLDFTVHGDAGFAGPWASRASVGDRLQFSGPGGSYRPAPDAQWHLLMGDESALPALASSLEAIQRRVRVVAVVVVDGPGSVVPLSCGGDLDLRWLYRRETDSPFSLLADALDGVPFDAEDGPAEMFVHGEAAEVRAVRRRLVDEFGLDTSGASISPYWRRTMTDEEWREIKKEWLADEVTAPA